MPLVRLNKHLASLGVASRRKIDQFLEENRITVNDQVVKVGVKIDPQQDQIKVDGQLIKTLSQPNLVYFMLNKPAGVVCTVADPQERTTVIELLKVNFPNLAERVYPVGRLDYDSEGLVLLTNDGELTYRLTHPKHGVEKVYLVWLDKEISANLIAKLESGIDLAEGKTAPAKVELIEQSIQGVVLKITLHQGWNRQIRRMIEKVGAKVMRLQRISMANLNLGNLPQAKVKVLTKAEILALKDL